MVSKLSLYFSLPQRSVMSSARARNTPRITASLQKRHNVKLYLFSFDSDSDTWEQLHQAVQTLLLGLLPLFCTPLWPRLGRQRAAWPDSLLQHLKVNHPAGGAGEVGNPYLQPSESEVFQEGSATVCIARVGTSNQ